MLGGPLDQTALHREDNLSSSQNAELLQGKESNMSLVSWHSSRLKRVARSSSAAETQAAADGDDEAVYIRLCLQAASLDFRHGLNDSQSFAYREETAIGELASEVIVVIVTMLTVSLQTA